MTQKFLDGTNIVSALQKMRRKGMPEGMTRGSFCYASPEDSVSDRLLNQGFVHVMAALFPCFGIAPPVSLREDPLPAPFGGGVGILAVQGVWHLNAPPSFGQVPTMNRLDLPEVILQRDTKRFGQHGDPVFGPFAVADHDLLSGEVDVLYAQTQTFHQPKAGAIHERGHQPFVAGKLPEYSLDLFTGHNDGEPLRFPRADDFAKVADVAADDVAIQEKQGRKRLVLGRGADLFFDRKMGQKRIDLRLGHLRRVPDVMEIDESSDPEAIGLLGSPAIMTGTQRLTEAV